MSTVGIVGRGFISVLVAKLAALAGYNTWMLYPPNELETIHSLIQINEDDPLPPNLEFLSILDGDVVQERMRDTEALVFAVDGPDNGVIDLDVIKFLLNEDTASSLKRVVMMSRNLNGKGMGFLVKAAKTTANNEVWAGGDDQVRIYKEYENQVKTIVQKSCDNQETDVVVVRVGTLKGGACGEETFPQFLSPKFYEITKKDIITWQLLFDCNVRGVKLFPGDTMPGPGGKAILTATATEACDGDSSRCGVAEAIVKCLSVDGVKGGDFAVGTVDSRDPPGNEDWNEMLKSVMS